MTPEHLNEIFQNKALTCNLRTNTNFSSSQIYSISGAGALLEIEGSDQQGYKRALFP